MKIKSNYKMISLSLILAGVISGCNSGLHNGGGQTVVATPVKANQTANLFTQNTLLKGILSFDQTNSNWYLGNVGIKITNTSNEDIDLSKTTISFTSQDVNGNLANVDGGKFNNWSINDTSYHVLFTSGNGTTLLGSISAQNGKNPIIKPGQTIEFKGGISLNGAEYNKEVASNSFSLDGSIQPSPSPSPSPVPSPDPANNCNGVAIWDASKVYTANQKVQYAGIEYAAKWWTQGDKPSSTDTNGPWKFEQKCSNITPSPTPEPTKAPDPVINTGELDVIVDTTNTDCKNSSFCHGLTINVTDQSGQQVTSPIIVPDSALGGVFTQPIQGLSANVAYSVATSGVDNATVSYDPASAKATVIKGGIVKVTAKYNKIEPTVATGTIKVSVPTVVPNYTGDVAVDIINSANSNSVVGTYLIKQGASFTTDRLPVSDNKNQYLVRMSKGLADPKAGLYYVESGTPLVVVNKDQTTNITLPLVKTKKALNKVIINVTGLDTNDVADVSFEDAAHTFVYVNDAGVKNSTNTYFVESGLNFGVSLVSNGSGFYDTNQFVFTGVVNKDTTYDAKFTKQAAPQLTYNYDYFDPKNPPSKGFQDYNYNINLTLNGVAKPKTVVITTNFKPSALAGGTCFGQGIWGDGIKLSTETSGSLFKTTITTTNTFDLSDRCLISGGNTGNAKTIIGTAVPYISAVSVDGVNVPIYQPCVANGCKDPGNGYVNAGYYANWAVWGRSYDPNKMPFDKINDIIYAFIGFNPQTGDLKTLDDSPDYWGLTATTKALMQYPYMHAHLSFGGWTNAGINTAPMFQQLSSNPEAMKKFAAQAVQLMQQTKFSGLDIDWEWWSDYSNNQAPAKQMLAFYNILRSELDKAGAKDGKHYTLTIAVNAGVDRLNAMQNTASNPNAVVDFWKQVNGLVDQINLMTYDYHGAYDQDAAYFHANYDFANVPADKQAAVGQTSGWSIKDVVAAFQANGVPAKKLVVGLPIYARTMKVSSNTNGGLLQPISGAGFGDWENGVLDYKCLLNPVKDPISGCGNKEAPTDIVFYNATATGSILDTFNKFGRDALQPWGYSPSTGTFITFDDVWSVRAKTQKVIDQKLGGTMFWELDGDSTDVNKSLVTAVSNKYLGK